MTDANINSCHISRAADGDVAIIIESDGLDEVASVDARLVGDHLTVSQGGRVLLSAGGLSKWSQEQIRSAPKLCLVAMTNPGRPTESIAMSLDVRLDA